MATPSVFLVFSSQLAAGVSAANAATTPNDVIGTVIGVGQSAQSIASIATTTITTKSISVVPGAGAALGLWGARNNYNSITQDLGPTSETGGKVQATPSRLVLVLL